MTPLMKGVSQGVNDDVIKWKAFRVTGPLCVGNSPVTGKFSLQRAINADFDVFVCGFAYAVKQAVG